MADQGRSDELTGIIEGTPLTGSVVWMHDAEVEAGTEPGRHIALDILPEQTRELDLDILESLRGEGAYAPPAEITQIARFEATQVAPLPGELTPTDDLEPHAAGDATELAATRPAVAAPTRRGPPPPAHSAQWFAALDSAGEGSDTSPSRPSPRREDAAPVAAAAHPEPAPLGEPSIRRPLLAQAEEAIVNMAYRYPGWGMVRVTNALRREGVDVNVKEVSEVMSRYAVWSPLGRAALQKEMDRRSPRSSMGRRLLLGFELLAFATLTLAVAMAWLSM